MGLILAFGQGLGDCGTTDCKITPQSLNLPVSPSSLRVLQLLSQQRLDDLLGLLVLAFTDL